MSPHDKPLVWLKGEVKTPPVRDAARIEAGDAEANWRLMYYIADDAIVVLEVFAKKTGETPRAVLDACRQRLALYKKVTKGPRDAR